MRIHNGVRHGMRLMSNAMAIAPKVASTPNNPVMLMNAALRWMPNFSHPGMDRIMQATGRRNIGRYRLATMRSCRQLHRQYTANSAGLIGDQNGAYRPSVVPSTGRKAMASSSHWRSCRFWASCWRSTRPAHCSTSSAKHYSPSPSASGADTGLTCCGTRHPPQSILSPEHASQSHRFHGK